MYTFPYMDVYSHMLNIYLIRDKTNLDVTVCDIAYIQST
jgi:hypothetical protein